MKNYSLNCETSIPPIGFGTWKIPDGEQTIQAVTAAITTGYRLIDTAKLYGNENSVGAAVRGSDVARDELFVTTKLWNDQQGYDSALRAFDESFTRLGLDYIDLYLIHWPATQNHSDAWRALGDIFESGRSRAVGVSNYEVEHLQELRKHSSLVPAVNQIEFHPFVYREQEETLVYCQRQGIVVEAYSPLARGRAVQDPLIRSIAGDLGKSAAQVMLRWAVQHGTVPIPKSVSAERMKENFEVFDFELSKSQMAAIDNIS